jgi:hypothetical protein
MNTYESKIAVAQGSAPGLTPTIGVTIAVDTAYIAATAGTSINTGIYMMDNMFQNGSTNEGQLELHTVGANGNLIGWEVVPIDVNAAANGVSVAITGFTVSQGNVFGSAGYPMQQDPAGTYWIGQLMNQGIQTYQVQIAVTVGAIRPVTYYVNWDPFITSK